GAWLSAKRGSRTATAPRWVGGAGAPPGPPPAPTVRLVTPPHRVSPERWVRRAHPGRRVPPMGRRDRPAPKDRRALSGRRACRESSDRPVHRAESDWSVRLVLRALRVRPGLPVRRVRRAVWGPRV